MDVIEALDVGAYVHFVFVAKNKVPQVVPLMQVAYYISTYYGGSVLALLAMIVAMRQRRQLAGLYFALCFVLAACVVELVRFLVPRRRPDDALELVGADSMLGSYPSSSVLLFMLGVNLLGIALWPGMKRRSLRSAFVILAAGLTIWVCMSQLFLAVCFLTDILGGIAGATLFGFITYRLVATCHIDQLPPVNQDPFPEPAFTRAPG